MSTRHAMNIFLCDIIGTFDGDDKTSDDVKEFFDNLTITIKELGIDNITFSFMTNNNIDYCFPFIEEIKPYMNDTIKEGIHYGYRDVYDHGNIKEIDLHGKIEQVEGILEYDKPVRIILADDSLSNQELSNLVISTYSPDVEVISLIPGEQNGPINSFVSNTKGIKGLIDCLKQYQKIITQNKDMQIEKK